MIVECSALCAIVFREPGYEAFEAALAEGGASVGAPTAVETAIVIAARLGHGGAEALLGAVRGRPSLGRVERFEIAVIDFTAEHWRIAANAYSRFGRGRLPAGLNFRRLPRLRDSSLG